MKKIVIGFTALVIILMVVCGVLFDKPHQQYAKSFIVVDLDYDKDIVTIEDFNGFTWEFFGCDDWEKGDICAALMDDNGTTETIFDDCIVNTTYCGWIF